MILLLISCLLTVSQCANILMTTPVGTQSDKVVFEALAQGLAKKGHRVTLLSSFNQTTKAEGVTELVIGNGKRPISFDHYHCATFSDLLEYVQELYYSSGVGARFIEDPAVSQLVDSQITYDLLINNAAHNELMLYFAYKFNIPFVYLSTTGDVSWVSESLRIPSNLASQPLQCCSHSEDMSFTQRVINYGIYWIFQVLRVRVMLPQSTKIIRQYLDNTIPNLGDIERNMSLMIVNNHWNMEYPRTYPPHVVEAGCLHCRPGRVLSTVTLIQSQMVIRFI